MMGTATLRAAVITAFAASVAACGGGGVNSTPAPPPAPTPTHTKTTKPDPNGANSSLLTPLKSETFAVIGSLGTIAVPTSGANVTAQAGASTPTFSYDATSQTYTMSSAGASQSFASGDVDPAQSNAQITTFKRTPNSTTTDFLTLVKNGTGAGQTQYVGAAFWQRQVNGTTATNGSFNAVTYGVETPSGATPRTGSASFDVNLLGVRSFSTLIYAVSGSGTIYADFLSGGMWGRGTYNEKDTQTGIGVNGAGWNMAALLSSSSNRFSGNFGMDTIGQGETRGGLYGPGAQEIGGTYSINPDSQQAAVGVYYGARGTSPVNTATNLTIPSSPMFYKPLIASMKANRDAAGLLSNLATGSNLASIFQNTNGGPLLLYYTDGRIVAPGQQGLSVQVNDLDFSSVRGFGALGQAGGFSDYLAGVFGLYTPASAVPVTGTGVYDVRLYGAAAAPGSKLNQVTGNGTMQIDFAAGSLNSNGNYTIDNATPTVSLGFGSTLESGTWTAAGTIGSTKGWSGTMALTGPTNYSGTMSGNFFGTAAQELGGTANLTSAGGGRITASLTGAANAAASSSLIPLANLTTSTALTTMTYPVRYDYTPAANTYSYPAAYGVREPALGGLVNYYNPTSTTERLKVDSGPAPTGSTLVKVGDQNKSAADSTAAVNVYTGVYNQTDYFSPGTYRVEHYVTDGLGGRIALNYTSLDAIYLRGNTYNDPSNPATNRDTISAYFQAFGNATVQSQMPKTGTATYNGIVIGRGWIGGGATPSVYDLSGTSGVNINFQSALMTGSITLNGRNLVDSTLASFGTYDFTGTVNGANGFGTTYSTFFATGNGPNYTGEWQGLFFGPQAVEHGGVFKIEVLNANGISYGVFTGATAGKKN